MSTTKNTQKHYENHHKRQLTSKISSESVNLELGHIIKKMLKTIKTHSKENMDDETGKHFSRMTRAIVRMADQIAE